MSFILRLQLAVRSLLTVHKAHLIQQSYIGLMSSRAVSSKHILPTNPTWLEFERSDGDPANWPTNTTREVDHEGHVNYMRVNTLDEPLAIKWRVEVGKALAEHMGLQREPHLTYLA